MTNTNEKDFLYEKPIRFGAGYLNLGNTCYMNATIHGFTSLGDLVAYFFQKKFENENNGKLGYDFNCIIKSQTEGQMKYLDLSDLRKSLNYASPKFNKADPYDSQEYVTYVYNTILKNYPDCPLKLTQFNLLSIVEPKKNKFVDILRLILPPGTQAKDGIDLDNIILYNLTGYLIDKSRKYMIINMELDNEGVLKKEINLKVDVDNISFSAFLKNKTEKFFFFFFFFKKIIIIIV
jgi:hypothetical protein